MASTTRTTAGNLAPLIGDASPAELMAALKPHVWRLLPTRVWQASCASLEQRAEAADARAAAGEGRARAAEEELAAARHELGGLRATITLHRLADMAGVDLPRVVHELEHQTFDNVALHAAATRADHEASLLAREALAGELAALESYGEGSAPGAES